MTEHSPREIAERVLYHPLAVSNTQCAQAIEERRTLARAIVAIEPSLLRMAADDLDAAYPAAPAVKLSHALRHYAALLDGTEAG